MFYEQHLDPACEADTVLHQKVVEMDEIDLHGWILRVLLPEYRRLGNQLHPADPDKRCIADAEAFARWLHRLAARKPGDETLPLSYDGVYLRVAVIWVAVPQKLATQGSEPYRKRAKSLIYPTPLNHTSPDNSAIEWTEATWNPITGRDKVSAGLRALLRGDVR